MPVFTALILGVGMFEIDVLPRSAAAAMIPPASGIASAGGAVAATVPAGGFAGGFFPNLAHNFLADASPL